MISGQVNGPDDYYGITKLNTVQNKKLRKMKRTQLSNEKKSNPSHKSFSSQRDSHLSHLKSKRTVNNNNSVLKNQQSNSYKNSLLGGNENNLPSCTEIHSTNQPSTRKSRLQINTGVVGIKMESVSPNKVLCHPSKVLFVNESTSGKKGSKTKKQKSILYVEYNNFMTEFNNNKNQKKPNASNGKNNENYKRNNYDSSNNKKQVNSKKNIKLQDIDNEYFTGMKRQFLSPVHKMNTVQKNQTKQKNSSQSQNIIETPNNKKSKFMQSPNIYQSSLANLSLSSAMGDKLQSPKLLTNSPKMLKTEPIDFKEKQQSKSKISMQNIVTLKEKNTTVQSNNSIIKNQSNGKQNIKIQKSNEQKQLKVNFLQNFYLISSNQNLKQKQNPSSRQSQKPIYVSSQKQLQDCNYIPLIKYNTQKQFDRQVNQEKITSERKIQSNQNLVNPYYLKKDENLVTNYQKKKILTPLQQFSKQNIQNTPDQNPKGLFSDKKGKQSIIKAQQDQNISAISESVLSQNSSKNGRRLKKQFKSDSSGSMTKILLKKSQSKIKLPDIQRNLKQSQSNQPKSGQSNQNYYRPRISVHQLLKNNQNQSKVSDVNSDQKSSKIKKNSSKLSLSRQIEKNQSSQINRFQDYKTEYYTPNPYSNKHIQSASKISKKNNDSQIGSDLESNISQLQKFDDQSQAAQVSDINDQSSLKSGKNKFLTSSSRLKRQQILRKNNLRSSKNSQKSIKSNISKKISIIHKKSSQHQIKIYQQKNLTQEKSNKNFQEVQIYNKSQSRKSSKSNQSFSQASQIEASIVKFIDKNLNSQGLSNQNSKQNNSIVPKRSSLHPSEYKDQLRVQNIQSQIQPYQHSKINDLKIRNQIKHDGFFNKLVDGSRHLNPLNQIYSVPEYKDLSQSNHSSKMISSMKRSGLRKSIKNSIHHLSDHLKSSLSASKHPKSNLLAKSSKDLKPLTNTNSKIQDFLAYIDEYEITIGFLYLYVQNTLQFYCKQSEERVAPQTERFLNKIKNQKLLKYEDKFERLSFLVLKKYYYQKNRLIKCLRGLESNVFKLTGLQVPDEILKKFIPHQQTRQKLKQIQLEAKQMFKQLDERFRALRSKGKYKRDKLIKIQAPYDNFSRDIVQNLVEELNELTAEIDELEIDTSSSNPSIPLKRSKHFQSLTSVIAQQIFTSQERGVQIMELVFLISELQLRKTKKVELLNISDIDFQVYYEKYIDKLLQTYEFFVSIKYPSDEKA